MRDRTVKALSSLHAVLFRISRGRVGSRLVDNDMLLLATVGRRSGNRHTIPLLYLRDGADFVVIASYGGRPHHPDWYTNRVAMPEASITVGADTIAVLASTMGTKERAVWWPRAVAAYAAYGAYQERTDLTIPIVRLTPVR